MEHFLILGRNPYLSRAEIFSYLELSQINYKEIFFKRNYLVLELPETFRFNIQDFGGTLKSGKIIFSGDEKELKEFINKNELIEKDKFTYSVSGNVSDELLIDKFKRERKKALIRRGHKKISFQNRDVSSLARAEFEIFIYHNEDNDKVYFGLVEKIYDYKQIIKRDMKKPIRRESLAISPRLAKILINLSQAKPGELLLDPFCGIGGILIESLVRGINVYGVDKDKKAIEQSKQNLKWLENNFKINASYKLQSVDARKTPNIKFDAIASEPSLGRITRRKPSNNEAQQIISQFEKLIISVLQKLVKLKKQNAKIAITMPYIRKFSVDIEMVCKRTGLKISKLENINFPIKEFRPDQFISREIVVLE